MTPGASRPRNKPPVGRKLTQLSPSGGREGRAGCQSPTPLVPRRIWMHGAKREPARF